MIYNLPNLLTLLRIALIPVFVVVFYLPVGWSNLVATVIFCLAAITDWLDGYLARRLEQTSLFGAFMDPVADKLMVVIALILLIERNPTAFASMIMTLPAAVIISREIVVSALREWMAELGERTQVAVSTIGKVKTTVQMFAIPFLLYKKDIGMMPTAETGIVLLYIAAVLTLWSMMIYVKAAWPMLVGDNQK